MILLDEERRIFEANRATAAMLGVAREAIIGRSADSFLDSDEWRSFDTEWRAFQHLGDFAGERAVVRADGVRVVVQYAAWWTELDGRRLALYVALEVSPRDHPVQVTDSIAHEAEMLSPREREVVGLIALGLRAHEIAGELDIAPSTVRSHTRNAMDKCSARSQAQLVAIFCAGGLSGQSTRPMSGLGKFVDASAARSAMITRSEAKPPRPRRRALP
jgi:PAS domain S-box-containing protein